MNLATRHTGAAPSIWRQEECDPGLKSEVGIEHPRRDLPEFTFQFARRVVTLCQVLDQTPGVNRTLANQLLRSGTSMGANVEEAQAGQSRADFLSKLSIACKEVREPHYWLRLVAATELVSESRLTELLEEAN